jgi:hypothetical protein
LDWIRSAFLMVTIIAVLEAAHEAIEEELGKPVDSRWETIESYEGRGTLAARTFRDFLRFYVDHLDRLTQPG